MALLLIAALPTKLGAAAALAVFAPMSAISMTFCTTVFAWLLTRRLIDPLYRNVLIPAFGLFGLFFGAWYVGLGWRPRRTPQVSDPKPGVAGLL